MRQHAEDDADIITDDALTVSTYTTSDPEAGTVTLSLQGADAGKFRIADDGGALTFRDAPNYEAPTDAGADNVYNVTVVATDDGVEGDGRHQMTAMRQVTIMVTNEEEDGTVSLSAQQPRIGVPITASVTDLDGDVTGVTWEWERDDDEENNDTAEEIIDGATSATYTPTADDEDKYLRAIAMYTDGKGIDMTAMTSVAQAEVRTDNAPTFLRTESGKRSIDENSPADTVVQRGALDGSINVPADDPEDSVQATDSESQLLTYGLSGADAGSFTITQDVPNTADADEGGQLAVKAGTKLDYETKSTYMVTVTATDPDNLSASIDVTITVNDVNEAPGVTEIAAINYAENGTGSVSSFTATDPEGRPVYWSLLDAPGNIEVDGAQLLPADVADDEHFSISAAGVLTFNIPPDYESPADGGTNNVYNIVLVASDDAPGGGGMMGYEKVTVTVTDVAEPGIVTLPSLQPQVLISLTAVLTDAEVENAQITAATWKWEQSRSRTSGWTAISGGDAAALIPDATTTGYYLRATATYKDADDNDKTAHGVSVNKVRATPTSTDRDAEFPGDANARSVAENSPARTNVGDPVKANDIADDVLTYSLTANEGGFEIDPATAQIKVGPRTVLNHENDASYTVTVTVTEANGDTVTQSVTITVRDVNEAPMVTLGGTLLMYAENTAATEAVSTYTTSDPEAGTVTLSLQGADAGKFRIADDGGALTFRDAPNYEAPTDAGADNVYNVTVVATDDGVESDGRSKMTAMRQVTIMVTNEEEDGTVSLSTRQPKIGVPLTASVTDLDGDVTGVTWEWERDDDEENNDTAEETIDGATSATYTPTRG